MTAGDRKLVFLFVVAAVVAAVTFLWNRPVIAPTPQDAPERTYRNMGYGFSLSYPKTLIPETEFRRYHSLGISWRADAPEESAGVPVVAIPIVRIENESSYPRYFAAEVRVGVSGALDDLQNCLLPDPFYTNAAVSKEIINGTEFVAITFGGAGMMQYLEGVSYRAVRNGRCYAIETVKTGASYRDDPASDEDVSDETLDGYYRQTFDIVKTFRFLN